MRGRDSDISRLQENYVLDPGCLGGARKGWTMEQN
jgi:hypothetical protein